MACGFYALMVREILVGAEPSEAYRRAVSEFTAQYVFEPFASERLRFRDLESGLLAKADELEIGSGGYVMETLTAAIWCCLTCGTLEDTLLRAVNLACDSDTTGCVTGGLAGAYYGGQAIPEAWKTIIARANEIEVLVDSFIDALKQREFSVQLESAATKTLFRPVGPKELELIAASGFCEFPARLSDQPIFYPVLNEEYAREIAKSWNVPASGSGYVMRFNVRTKFVDQYPVKVVGGAQHQELWIPAEDLPEFNRNIVGKIEVIAEFNT
jgi:hypothetical protein